jgi:hypothetical protein
VYRCPNYESATGNMFREVMKWTSRVFLGNATLFETLIALHKINVHVIDCKNASFGISLKNILGSLHSQHY